MFGSLIVLVFDDVFMMMLLFWIIMCGIDVLVRSIGVFMFIVNILF